MFYVYCVALLFYICSICFINVLFICVICFCYFILCFLYVLLCVFSVLFCICMRFWCVTFFYYLYTVFYLCLFVLHLFSICFYLILFLFFIFVFDLIKNNIQETAATPRIAFPSHRAPIHRARGWNIPFGRTPHCDFWPIRTASVRLFVGPARANVKNGREPQ